MRVKVVTIHWCFVYFEKKREQDMMRDILVRRDDRGVWNMTACHTNTDRQKNKKKKRKKKEKKRERKNNET